MDKITKFWQEFLTANQLEATTSYYEAFAFGSTASSATTLARLVLSGKKTATSSALRAYQTAQEQPPQVGNYSIVTDWDDNPRAVIKTTKVTVIPFNEMTYEICKKEGEDTALESWVANHREFFTKDSQNQGYQFTDDMPVFFEEFILVWPDHNQKTNA